MSLLLLVACVRLREGDYDVDYSPVSIDTCNLYNGGQVGPDAEGELTWDDGQIVFEFDGDDEELEFTVNGKEFSRSSEYYYQLDDQCSLRAERDDDGEMLSNTEFEGETEVTADLAGSCTMWEVMLDTPCLVEFSWEGEYDD